MSEYYPEIRLVHVYAVIASGSLFLLRGILLFSGAPWAGAAALRILSYGVDTVLLTAALMLTSIIGQYPFVHSWLTVKVMLLFVYIALGVLAFRTRYTRAFRLSAWFLALGVFAFIVSVARAHHPLGFLYTL